MSSSSCWRRAAIWPALGDPGLCPGRCDRLVANLFLSGGLKLQETPAHLALGMALALVMGVVGGPYPAWRASGLAPMEAIRKGTH